HRSEAVWRYVMQAPEVQDGLAKAGFQPTPVAVEDASSVEPLSLDVWPNPARTQATARVAQVPPGPARLTLFDVLGRAVWTAEVATDAVIPLPLDGLGAGAYVLRLQTTRGTISRTLLHVP